MSDQWYGESAIPEPIITSNPDGTKTIVTFRIDESGKKLKITQKVREIKVTEKVNKAVASRKKWAKFGLEANAAPGPDYRTTQLGEEIKLRLGTAWKSLEETAEAAEKKDAAAGGDKVARIRCRLCDGAHFTSKCPYKDTLGAEDKAAPADAPADVTATGGRYVPPSRRNRDPSANAAQDGMRDQRERDDARTLKIAQINETVDENMLRSELLYPFGKILRCNIVRNKETGRSRGLAFVTFETEQMAETALQYLNGRGFMSLILQVEWSKPKKQ